MTAYDKGLRRARECLQAFSIEQLATTTLDEFCALGRLDGKQRYKREDAQSDYAAAWRMVGESFATLLKPSSNDFIVATEILDALKSTLQRANEYVERLKGWESSMEYVKLLIDDTAFMVVSSIEDVEELLERLRQAKDSA